MAGKLQVKPQAQAQAETVELVELVEQSPEQVTALVEQVEALTAEAVPEADPWADAVAAPIAPAFTRARVDIVKEIPESLRALFEQSHGDYFEVMESAGLGENTAKFRQFDAKTPERADAFVKMAKMWAKNRRVASAPNEGQVSMRAFRIKKDDKLTNVVKFAVMPLVKSEPRAARPAQNGPAPAIIRDWAKSKGIAVPSHGRIPAELRAQYLAEVQPTPAVTEQPAADIPPSL
jgi:hypothetical protein